MIAVPANTRLRVAAAPRSAIVAMPLLAAAFVLLYVTLATSDQPTRAVVWGGLALASYAAGLLCFVGAWRGTRLGLSDWKCGSWTLLWYCAAFGVGTTTWNQGPMGLASQIAASSVLRALWLIAVGMTIWILGYLVGPGQPTRSLAARGVAALGQRLTADVRSPLAPWILYAVGTVARLASAAMTGHFGYVGDASSVVSAPAGYGQIVGDLTFCAPLAVAAAAMQVFRERQKGARVALAVLFLAELASAVVSGDKQNFIVAVLAVVIPFSAARHRLPKAALSLAAAAFLIILVPFTLTYRNVARDGPETLTSSEAADAAPRLLGQASTGGNVATVLPESFGYLLQRVREINDTAIIVQRTPRQFGYLSSAELIEAPIAAVVPRAIWPTKPILATGYQISQEYYGLSPTVYTSSAISQAGDLYRYGGWIPVIAGMFLLGCGVRLLDDVLDVRSNPHAIFLVLVLFPTLVKNEVGWIPILASIPGTLLIWLLAVALTFRRRSA